MDMNTLWESLQSALGGHIPQLMGALGIFVLGWLIAVVVRAGARRSLGALKVNQRFGNLTGAKVDAQALIQGRVTGVEMYSGAPYLVIGDSILPLSTVISLNEIRSQAANDTDDTENPNVPTEEAAA